MIFTTNKVVPRLPKCIISKYVGLLGILLQITGLSGFSQPESTVGLKANRLLKVIENTHFQPTKIDSSNAIKVIETMLTALDPYATYFMKADATELLKYSDSLQIDLETYSNKVVDRTIFLFAERLQYADSLVSELLKQAIDFHKNDILDMETEGPLSFPQGHNAYTYKWHKVLKIRILRELHTIARDTINIQKPWSEIFIQNEGDLIKRVDTISKLRIKKIKEAPEGFDQFVHSAFLNSLASINDPHTNYFSSSKKQEFEESLSKNFTGFGISHFDNDRGQVEIDYIMIGSPAWFCYSLEVGDIILSVRPTDKSEVDVSFLDSRELNELIGPNSISGMEIKVRKANGRIIAQKLIKSIIESENYARSFMLKGSKTIGYITLPGFYTSYESRNNAGCALDVMREIVKLKQDSIEGLIIDLRQNTGGALYEAVDIASIFIEKGDIAKLKTRNLGNQILTRNNVGITYSDPLVVLVDQASASASELVAGILKIYNRAVIVGSNTFGKFSGQVILPLNREMSNKNQFNNENYMGFAKITNQKTYLANGACYQSMGIEPDIELPNFFNNIQFREEGLKNPIKADTIIDASLNIEPLSMLPISQLQSKSMERVAANKNFGAISKLKDELNIIQDAYKKTLLHIDSFQLEMEQYDQITQSAKELQEYKVEKFTAENNRFDIQLFTQNTNKKIINERLLQSIEKDPYIEEAHSVLCDLIELLRTSNKE